MPVYRVQAPDGSVLRIEGPDGATEQQLASVALSHAPASFASTADREMANPAAGMSGIEKFRAGWGKAAADMWRGAQQLAAPSDSLQKEVNESKTLDAPLMSTGAGMAGNIAGQFATVVPSLAIPGANTVAGAGLLGAAQGALQPVATGESRGLNIATGAGGGMIGQAVGNKIASTAGNYLTQRATQQGQNVLRDATLQAGKDAGYVLPPSAIEPGFITNRLEGIAGKAALGQEASARNQQITNRLVRQELGIPENQAISQPALESIRKTAGQEYSKVAALNKNAADALDELKQARFDANAQYKFYARSGNPEALAKAKQAQADASTWEQFLESEAIRAGKPDLVQGMRDARVKIAKTYSVEKALNTSTGDIDAKALARAIDQGAPLSGGLETAGRFADAFPRYTQASPPTAGVSKLEGALSGILGLAGHSAMGPWGAAMAALPMASPAVRAALLSRPGQAMLSGVPNYAPGVLAPMLSGPMTAPMLGVLGTQGALLSR